MLAIRGLIRFPFLVTRIQELRKEKKSLQYSRFMSLTEYINININSRGFRSFQNTFKMW